MLSTGSRLGPYEILSSLGAGGMGQVYKARDTRLGRIVAIKVLAPHLPESPERRQRFEREARAVSALNHAHICTFHDIGNQDGTHFLVMEYIEGGTLAERLKKGALPLEEAVRYGAQIADALDKAHRQGIVHRDLKPSNIMLTREGVKLLDFGLAKLRAGEAGVVVDSSAPTEAHTLTAEGAILGTLQYMAPEQLEGKDVDARADLFAFGGILYEMVTGRPAFQGRSRASLIAAILEHDPAPVSTVQSTASPALDHAIGRCLEKDPEERWQSALDLKNELEWIAGFGAESTRLAVVAPNRRAPLVTTVVAGFALVVALLAGLRVAREPAPPRNVIRSAIPIEPSLAPLHTWPSVAAPAVAVSADGRYVAYTGERDGRTEIYLRATNESQAKRVDGSEGGYEPFFSPDGRWLGFVARGVIWRVPVGGGAPVSVFRGSGARGANWGADGYVYFTPSDSAGIWRVRASGGEPEQLTKSELEKREKSHRFPELLPNGKGVLYTMGSADLESFDEARIEVLELDSGKRRVLIEGATNARYVPTGHIVYARASSLFAVPFDAERFEVTGTPVSVLEGVTTSPAYGSAHFAVSGDGLLVFAPGGSRGRRERLVWVDPNGTPEPVPGMERNFLDPRISPDGSRVAVSADDATVSIWVYELSRGTWSRSISGWNNMAPVWEPNGAYVTFQSDRAGPDNLFRQAVDGSGPAERLTRSERRAGSWSTGSWSPDGSILTMLLLPEQDIWALAIGDGSEPYPLLDSRALESAPEISPDGRWLAYVSDESGRREVYVQPFPGLGPRVQISTDGGAEPAWARSGRELFYRQEDKMMVVDIEAGEVVKPSRPKMLFDASRYEANANRYSRNYDISPDGSFLMIEEIEPEPTLTHLTLIVNWFDELRSRFATQ